MSWSKASCRELCMSDVSYEIGASCSHRELLSGALIEYFRTYPGRK